MGPPWLAPSPRFYAADATVDMHYYVLANLQLTAKALLGRASGLTPDEQMYWLAVVAGSPDPDEGAAIIHLCRGESKAPMSAWRAVAPAETAALAYAAGFTPAEMVNRSDVADAAELRALAALRGYRLPD